MWTYVCGARIVQQRRCQVDVDSIPTKTIKAKLCNLHQLKLNVSRFLDCTHFYAGYLHILSRHVLYTVAGLGFDLNYWGRNFVNGRGGVENHKNVHLFNDFFTKSR